MSIDPRGSPPPLPSASFFGPKAARFASSCEAMIAKRSVRVALSAQSGNGHGEDSPLSKRRRYVDQ